MENRKKKIHGVFEGGGVKGSALVGAAVATEELGYTFENMAGTSAGAIVAALLAAGYTAREVKGIMDDLDYSLLKDATMLSKIPYIGSGLSIIFRKGIYAGDFFEKWLAGLLAKKNVFTFKDLIIPENANYMQFRYKLQVVASDITNGRLLVLPRDSVDYLVEPDDLSVAFAVRMSMSIPYFYVPVTQKDKKGKSYIVDGGILSNFPVWLLDDGTDNPTIPTIGYKLVDPVEQRSNKISGPITLFKALFATMMEAHDARYIEDSDFKRTVPIPTLGVHTTDFSISQKVKDALFDSGHESAVKFFGKEMLVDIKNP